ncbi:MAG: hypothetical protein D6705_02835 [Deltaproteobacteria bacterium]|nr:MAG: hypothetical protein D6705_02835 [Deltaproteobacteria bacterium]
MTPWLAVPLVLPLVVGAWSLRRRGGVAAVVGACVGLATLTVSSTVLAVAGRFFAPGLTVAAIAAAAGTFALCRNGSRDPARWTAHGRPRWILRASLVVLVLVGAALRYPPMLFPLGGRDQGTYLLRARTLARTGTLDWTDPLLAELGRTPVPGDGDVTSVYRPDPDPQRAGWYEAGYRPGFYLASVGTGRVVPQFLHGQPVLLSAGTIAFGRGGEAYVVFGEAILGILAFAALALQVLRPPWSVLALAAYVLSPLAVWTARQTLSEPLAAVFVAGAAAAGVASPRIGWSAAATLLVGWATTRGDAWPLVAVVAFCMALAARTGSERRTVLGLCGALGAVVAVHAVTSYPYVHDEMQRQFGWDATPGALVAAGLGLAAAAASPLVLAGERRETLWRRLARWSGPLACAVIVAALAVWGIGPGDGRAARLDPLPAALDPWGVLLAVLGAFVVAWRRTSPKRRLADPFLPALGLAAALTCLAYGVQNLPRAHLYYYGRYLVPLLIPAALLSMAALGDAAFAVLRRRRGRAWATTLAAVPVAAAMLAPARIHATAPVTRIEEFADVGRGIDRLAAAIPRDAVVIAGGEGWHGSHTFNQVGGALAMDHARIVLPYRRDEAAYAAAYHLAVRRPAHLGTPPRPVFLLRNEASLPRDDREGRPQVVVDDEVPPPFEIVRRIDVDLVYDRLTPTEGALPRRVTRDGIRMVLLELGTGRDGPDGGTLPQRIRLAGCGRRDDPWRVDVPDAPWVRAVRLELEPTGDVAGLGRGALAVGTVTGDDRTGRLAIAPGQRTFGPFAVHPGTTVAAFADPPPARCDDLAVTAAWLGPWRAAPPAVDRIVHRPDDLHGVPAPPAVFASGRAFSPRRPTVRTPPRRGLSFVLDAHTPVDFGPVPVPRDGGCPLDVSATLRRRDVTDTARLEVRVGRHRATFDVRADGPAVMRTAPVAVGAPGPVARLAVRLDTETPETDRVLLRDVVLVPRCPPPVGGPGHGVPSAPSP